MSLLLLFGNAGEPSVAVQHPVRVVDGSGPRYRLADRSAPRYGAEDASEPRYQVTDRSGP